MPNRAFVAFVSRRLPEVGLRSSIRIPWLWRRSWPDSGGFRRRGHSPPDGCITETWPMDVEGSWNQIDV